MSLEILPPDAKPEALAEALTRDGACIVRDVLDGDAEAQIDAMWSYLALGPAMPLPTGLVVGHGADLIVIHERRRI